MNLKLLALPAAALVGALLFFAPFGNAHTPTAPGKGATPPPSLREGGRGDGPGLGSAPLTNYKVIYDTDLQKLVGNVHESLVQGWQVAGGIAVYVADGKVRYAQALVGK